MTHPWALPGEIELTVYGTPGAQGSKRHVGKGRMIESSERVEPWRNAVRSETQRALGERAPLADVPVSVTIIFTVAKPKSAPKTRRVWPIKKPDIDKLVRSTLDGLKDGGAYGDDAQVVDLFVRKRYVADPGCMWRPGARIAVDIVTEATAG